MLPGKFSRKLLFLLSTEDGTFWHILQCFVALLEKLGERIWQMPEFKFLPGDVFNIITENTIYRNYIQQRQEEREISPSQEACRDSSKPWLSSSSCRSYKTALAWFKPFVQSLLVFDSGGEHVSEVVRYLHNVAGRCHLFILRSYARLLYTETWRMFLKTLEYVSPRKTILCALGSFPEIRFLIFLHLVKKESYKMEKYIGIGCLKS